MKERLAQKDLWKKHVPTKTLKGTRFTRGLNTEAQGKTDELWTPLGSAQGRDLARQ